MMDNLPNIKYDFFRLLEYKSGDVKPLIVEQSTSKTNYTSYPRFVWKESPFKSKQEGNIFRKWMIDNYPDFSKKIKLDPTGSYNNSFIKKAYTTIAPNNTKTFGDIFSGGNKKYELDRPTNLTYSPDTVDTTYQKSIGKNMSEVEKSFKEGIAPYMNQLLTMGVPVHLRVFLDFLNGRTKPFTMADLTKEEQQTLGKMLNYAIKTKKLKSGQNLSFYDLSNVMNNGTEQFAFKEKGLGMNQLDIKNQTTKLGMTLGNATPVKISGGYQVNDIYDFNPYYDHPEWYTLKELPNNLKRVFNDIWGGDENYVGGLEKLASYKIKLGYKGFPVRINVPETLITD